MLCDTYAAMLLPVLLITLRVCFAVTLCYAYGADAARYTVESPFFAADAPCADAGAAR